MSKLNKVISSQTPPFVLFLVGPSRGEAACVCVCVCVCVSALGPGRGCGIPPPDQPKAHRRSCCVQANSNPLHASVLMENTACCLEAPELARF